MKKVLALLFVIIAAVCVFIACSRGVTPGADTGSEETSGAGAETKPPVEESAEVKKYRERNASFKTEDFGTVGKYERNFTSKIGTPPVTPTAGEHPRVMFNSDDLAAIIANLETDANNSAYRTLVSFARKTIKSASKGGELDLVELGRVEAMAFYYALTGDALYAQKAIYAIKQTILDVDCEKDFDPYRGYGAVMYVAGCVYDWCYDQLTEADREQIVFGTLKNLASRMEVGCPPSKEGAISHHTVECQIQKSYLSFAIAVYDEYPNIYNYVAKRLISNIAPAQNYFIASGMHWEGTAYGPFRGCYLM
ncbi:MAG: hypothetical protein J5563_05735 [Clostridia bacterium]|nr:hypothetical protein [Clostridia bacterium]